MGRLVDFVEYFKDKPYEFARLLHVSPTPDQELVLNSIPLAMQNRKHISVKSGHGVGKSAFLSWVLLWFLTTRPMARIIATAGKEDQIKDILWAELRQWHNKLPDYIRKEFSWTATEYYHLIYGSNWCAHARTATDPQNMAGQHAEHILYMIDEASTIKNEVFEVIQGALSTEGAFLIMTGNPTQNEGEFFNSFKRNRTSYTCFTFNSENATKYILPNGMKMVDPKYCTDMADKYGIDSDIYRVRVLGEFPLAGEDVLIALHKVENAVKRIDSKYTENDTIFIGVDPARFGDDETVMLIRRGNKVIHIEGWNKKDTQETAGRIYNFIMQHFSKLGFKVIISVDDTGVGGGVTDRLKYNIERDQATWIRLTAENNGGESKIKNEYGKKLYRNRGTELWAAVRDAIDDLDLPDDPELISQLSTRKFRFSSGLMELEKKEEMKKRGLKSPDRADALALTFAMDTQNVVDVVWV